ncbi:MULTISPECIES: YheU family protein [unclassified Colwellia]|uniref:YheU family protein n=1 Tax=unclassified Colwellia TaxID=196834 RepID=UPI0015F697CB|nr:MULTISPECIES: YheU family protein [unclassified Colwellia]MBA6232836.1 YheU family protein [Colwellia sp. MB02u-7]MBA6236071.1 YheU family protein [Colwellia sp. MB02u-11]MBA6256675.1 YheU family protein [Colwellia sp. MB3u-28]MBA6261390.1 YheU family protein [Colwellia sp. MB3u-41]MBA6298524.1 YheU family protein [Colwellia sp. MB3u-22]
MIIPYKDLEPDTLNSIIREFVLREGTEYGEADVPLSKKVADVKVQLANGSAFLVYSELHDTVNILPIDQFNQQENEQEAAQ